MLRNVVLSLNLLLLCLLPAKADNPHQHGINVPDWYESSCCSNNDCMPVKDEDIEFGIDYITGSPIVIYKPTGNTFFLKTPSGGRHYQHRMSQDERYHVCINPQTKASLCFYNRPGF